MPFHIKIYQCLVFWMIALRITRSIGLSERRMRKRYLPSGLTPCTLWSQPHFSSSPLLQALVTANATLAAEMAYTKAASRVPNTQRRIHKCTVKLFLYIRNTLRITEKCKKDRDVVSSAKECHDIDHHTKMTTHENAWSDLLSVWLGNEKLSHI